MNETKRTAGRLHLDDDLEPLYLFGEDMEMVAEVRGWGARLPQTENAKHLVACWNAFEAGGAVELAREALMKLLRAAGAVTPFLVRESEHRTDMSKAIDTARAALTALDAAREP